MSKLVVSRCALGWAIHGNREKRDYLPVYVIHSNEISKERSISCTNDELNLLMKSYFDLDSLGISQVPKDKPEVKHAIENLDSTSRYLNKKWEVGLLWKNDNETMNNGRYTALNRLCSLQKKLNRDPEYAKLYYREMNRLFENGFVVKAPKIPTGKRIRYSPHFGVKI